MRPAKASVETVERGGMKPRRAHARLDRPPPSARVHRGYGRREGILPYESARPKEQGAGRLISERIPCPCRGLGARGPPCIWYGRPKPPRGETTWRSTVRGCWTAVSALYSIDLQLRDLCQLVSVATCGTGSVQPGPRTRLGPHTQTATRAQTRDRDRTTSPLPVASRTHTLVTSRRQCINVCI